VASAHAQLEWTQPVQSSVLTSAPRQIVLHFGEPVEIDFGSLRVIGPTGARVDEGGTHHPGGDSHAVAIDLPGQLADGTYVVAWRVISADSHPVHGAFVFSVGTAAGARKANALAASLTHASGSTLVGVVYWFFRFAVFASLIFLVGVGTVVTLLWRRGGRTARVGAVLWWTWGVLLAVSVAAVAIQGVYAAALPLTDIFRPTLFDEVLHTRFGEVSILRVALLMAAVPAIRAARSPRTGRGHTWWALYGAAVALGLLTTPGLAGHAAATGSALVGMGLDVSHLAAASVWLGGLAVLAVLLVPGLTPDEPAGEIRRIARSVSALAFGAVVVVVASGVIQSIRQVGSFYALFNTSYGTILLVKVGLVVILLGVASVSRRLLLGRFGVRIPRQAPAPPGGAGDRALGPRPGRARGVAPGVDASRGGLAVALAEAAPAGDPDAGGPDRGNPDAGGPVRAEVPASDPGLRRGLRRSILAELALALGVLAVTALLVNAPPAKQAASEPFTQTFEVLGVQVNAIVSPARTGPGNQFHFYVLGPAGQPRAIPELDASITLPAGGIGPLSVPLVVSGPGHYVAQSVDIPFGGSWVLKLTVRTSPIDEQEVLATLPVH